MAKTRTFAVVGLGAFGMKVCETLREKGAAVIAMDHDADLVEKAKDIATMSILLDAMDEAALSKAPLDEVDIGIVAIGDRLEASILATAILKKRGVPYIVARAASEIHQQVLLQVGANEAVNIELDEGARVAHRLIAPDVLDSIPLSSEISLSEMYVPGAIVGQAMANLRLREKMRINVVAIKRGSMDVDEAGNMARSETLIFPAPEERLSESDVVFVVGRNEDIDAFRNLK